MDDDFFREEPRREKRRRERARALRRRRLLALAGVLVAVAAVVVILAASRGEDAGSRSGDHSSVAEATVTSVTPSPPATTESPEPAAALDEAPASPPAGTKPPLRRPTKKDPLRVYFGGDSLSGMPGVMFAQRAQRTGLMRVTVDYQTSSRLTVPDPVDWPARLRAQLGSRRYDAAAFIIGINDTGMPMVAGGSSTMYPSKAWLREYRDRVEELARVMLKGGAERVYWVGLPVMPQHGQTAAVKDLNEIFKEVAARHPDVVYVDTFPVLATKSGGFDPSVRSGDGVHFTNEGATLLGDAVWTAMQKDWHAAAPSPAPTPAPAVP